MSNLKPGDFVRMSESGKLRYLGPCGWGEHVMPASNKDDDYCLACSRGHVEEFGESIGVVEGLMDYNNKGEPYDPSKLGPEWDVRWDPDNLRYGYAAEDLEKLALL